MALSAGSAAGSLLAPRLLATNPLLVVALSPRAVYLAVVAGTMSLPAFLIVGMVRMMAGDPFHYLLGRQHGPAARAVLARRRPSFGRLAERLPRVDQKTGLIAVAASPTGKVLMLAGAAGLRPRLVALADAGGTFVQLTALYVVGRPLVRAVDWSPRVTALLGGAIVILTLAAGVVATRSPAAAVDRLALESGEA